jgi:hypothetical protein
MTSRTRNLEIKSTIYGDKITFRVQVQVATSTSGTLATSFIAGNIIDGYTLQLNDRILIKDQVSQIENGIYNVTNGPPIRSNDLSDGSIVNNIQVPVGGGTLNAGTIWICNNGLTASIVGTSNLNFLLSTITVNALQPAQGGTGLTSLTAGNFLIGNGTSTVDTSKVAPSGDVVGSSDLQTLTNKTLDTSTTVLQNGATVTQQIVFDLVGLTASRTFTLPDINGTLATETYVDNEISLLDDPTTAAKGFANLVSAQFLAEMGQPARTTQILMATTTGYAKWGSASNGNNVEVYASGADFLAGNLLQRYSMKLGEVLSLGGLSNGAVFVSTAGINGVGMNSATVPTSTSGGDSGVMPFGIEAFADKEFFFFAFRHSQGNFPGIGIVYIASGAVSSTVSLLDGIGQPIDGPVQLSPFSLAELKTAGNQEYRISSTEPVFASVGARIADNPGGAYYDLRLVPPLTFDMLGHTRNCRISARYPNTVIKIYMRDGVLGRYTISPGSPVSIYQNNGNQLGDVFEIRSDIVPATGSTFTLTINAETTAAINFNATNREVATALANLPSYSATDFDVYMASRDRLGTSEAIMRIECIGILARTIATPSLTSSLVGNPHTLSIIQLGNTNGNMGDDSDFAADGFMRVLANGPISGLTGADGEGLDATYNFPIKFIYQRVPIFLRNASNDNDVGSNGLSFVGPYEGTIRVYNSDGSIYNTVQMTRAVTVRSEYDQLSPAAVSFATQSSVLGIFSGGYAESDVPFVCIHNPNNEFDFATLPADEVRMHGEETVLIGTTPENIRVEVRKDGKGILRRRAVADDGTDTWIVA